MARPLRLEVANGIYHVVSRGNERGAIFRDDADRCRFLELLGQVGNRYHWRILAYCLMRNHYHLLVQTPEPNLARCMRQLNGVYAQWFNRRHARVGHLLQGRYGARLVQADEHLLSVVRYIVRNPVAACLCENPSAWRFSSHRATLGEEPPGYLDTRRLLSYYGPTCELARESYREHTERAGADREPADAVIAGNEAFVAGALASHRQPPPPGVPRRYVRGPRPELSDLLAERDWVSIERAHACGYSLREIANELGCHASTVSRRLKRCAS